MYSDVIFGPCFFLCVKQGRVPVKNMAKYWKIAREARFLPVKIFVNLHPWKTKSCTWKKLKITPVKTKKCPWKYPLGRNRMASPRLEQSHFHEYVDLLREGILVDEVSAHLLHDDLQVKFDMGIEHQCFVRYKVPPENYIYLLRPNLPSNWYILKENLRI